MSVEQPTPNMPADEVEQTIAERLGETESEPLHLLHQVVKKLGPEQALAFLKDTQEIEAQGGLLLPDASRRRTPGGVFFYLVRTRGPKPYAPLLAAENKTLIASSGCHGIWALLCASGMHLEVRAHHSVAFAARARCGTLTVIPY